MKDISTILLNERGVAYIAGTGMKVRYIAMEAVRLNRTAEEIHEAHENLSLEQIREALRYYHLNQSTIDAEIEAEDRYVEERRTNAGNQPTRAELQERLRLQRTV